MHPAWDNMAPRPGYDGTPDRKRDVRAKTGRAATVLCNETASITTIGNHINAHKHRAIFLFQHNSTNPRK